MSKQNLPTIGILGGMSSAATIEYYKLINEGVKAKLGEHALAELLICSVNFANIELFIREGNWAAAASYLGQKAHQLEQGGASSIFLATNTMHRVRDAIKAAITVPFIDIFETVSEAIKARGIRQVGILGTYPVMTDQFYIDAYASCGVDLIAPSEVDKQKINQIIFDELTQFKFTEASKSYYLEVIKRLAAEGAEGIILGCTEIKLLIKQADVPDIPLFDTTALHCEQAIESCLKGI